MSNAGIAHFMSQRERKRRNAASLRALAAPASESPPDLQAPHSPSALPLFLGAGFRIGNLLGFPAHSMPRNRARDVGTRRLNTTRETAAANNAVAIADMLQAEHALVASLRFAPQGNVQATALLASFVGALHDHLEALEILEADNPLAHSYSLIYTMQRYSRLISALEQGVPGVRTTASDTTMVSAAIHGHLVGRARRPLTQMDAIIVVNTFIVPHLHRMNLLALRQHSA